MNCLPKYSSFIRWPDYPGDTGKFLQVQGIYPVPISLSQILRQMMV